MNAKKKAASKSTAVMVKPWDAAEGAVMVFAGIDKITELAALAAQSSHITGITNAAGRDQVHALRMVLKNRRLEIGETGLEARRAALGFNRKVSAQESDYIELIQPEEDRLQKLQDDYDAEIEKKRQAEIDAEIARQAALQERIAELRGNRTLSPTCGSVLISEHIVDLEAIAVDESFEECVEQAIGAKADCLAWLRELHAEAVAHEVEQKRIADERIELARLRKEVAERATADAERERQAKVASDAEAARHAAQLRQQAADTARETAARQKVIDDENARVAASQPVIRSSGDEAKQEQVPEQVAPVVSDFVQSPQAIPSREEIVGTLCDHFLLDEAQIIAVLMRIDWQEALAEAA